MKKFVFTFLFLSLPIMIFANDNLQIAKEFIMNLSVGNFKMAESMYDEAMMAALPLAKTEAIWNQVESQAGKFQSIESVNVSNVQNYTVFVFTVSFSKALLDVTVTIDQNSKVAGLFFKPATPTYSIPSYVNQSKFKVEKTTIGNDLKVPAEITIPEGKGPFPAVILIPGSGPENMDESIGPNRPFEDIAYGLSTNGIVVLRYDKSTYVYPKAFQNGDIPVNLENEYFKDALDGINFLKSQNYVGKIFVLGHSEGGYLVPEIAKMSGDISGIIMLAAPARNLQDVTIDQLEYLISLSNNATEISAMKSIIVQLEDINKHTLKDSDIVMGAPVSYYYELEKYNPVGILKNLDIPTLIMQGGKDYQVTEKDFDIFKAAFSQNKNYTFKWYPNLYHLFIKWDGTPSPDEYLVEGHVDVNVIDEISTWIKSNQ
ncbi:DUF3887 domain-containing protein [Athalassotoga sp.]|uniref:DUF3887 domain-containing protein n=1 Tax=Athalassotoga sp. TaxID=2022597 RepID=UPI003CFE8DDA